MPGAPVAARGGDGAAHHAAGLGPAGHSRQDIAAVAGARISRSPNLRCRRGFRSNRVRRARSADKAARSNAARLGAPRGAPVTHLPDPHTTAETPVAPDRPRPGALHREEDHAARASQDRRPPAVRRRDHRCPARGGARGAEDDAASCSARCWCAGAASASIAICETLHEQLGLPVVQPRGSSRSTSTCSALVSEELATRYQRASAARSRASVAAARRAPRGHGRPAQQRGHRRPALPLRLLHRARARPRLGDRRGDHALLPPRRVDGRGARAASSPRTKRSSVTHIDDPGEPEAIDELIKEVDGRPIVRLTTGSSPRR